MGKIIVKRVTQVNGHSLKLHFCMFERSQGKHNIWIVISFLEYFPSIAKFKVHAQSLTQIKMFLHVQNILISKVDNP
jgi:hypothetical protein